MIDKKIKYIEELLVTENENVYLIIHSILYTIDFDELIDFYLFLPDSALKKSIESNLHKRIVLTPDAASMYDKLYSYLQKANYNQRQRVRKMLVLLLPLLGRIYMEDFFNNFYNSKYSNDVSSALTICKDIWSENLSTRILNDYLTTKKDMYLKAILEYGKIEDILQHINQIWLSEPSNYLKNCMVRKLAKNYIDKLDFIRETEPEKYLLAVSLSDKSFEDKFLADCLNDITDDLKHFGILSLSHMNKWELIEDEIKKYIH